MIDFSWILYVGGAVCFFTAWGGGANDCANSFSTAVGSGAITLKKALLIASVFEFGGAFLMGSHVTDTIRKGILDTTYFKDDPYVLMYGMFCSCLASGLWLLIATNYRLPVSTTHTTIGAIVGFGLVYNPKSVNIDQIIRIVISWGASPLAAGFMTIVMFTLLKHAALKHENAGRRIMNIFPILTLFMICIYSFFIIYKGTPALGLENTSLETSFIWSGGVGLFFAMMAYFIGRPYMKLKLKDMDCARNKSSKIAPETPVDDTVATKYDPDLTLEENATEFENAGTELRSRAKKQKLEELHQNARTFDPKAEKLCSSLQVITACFNSFAHGANDVANAIGPYAAIIVLYQTQTVTKDADVPWWILLIGALGIVTGLATWGYRIIERMGKEITKITPSRGFCIELGSTSAIIIASRLGIPVSTTHCQVGSVMGCGLMNGYKNVSWSIFFKVVLSWIVTVPIAAAISALIFSLGYYSPSSPHLPVANVTMLVSM